MFGSPGVCPPTHSGLMCPPQRPNTRSTLCRRNTRAMSSATGGPESFSVTHCSLSSVPLNDEPLQRIHDDLRRCTLKHHLFCSIATAIARQPWTASCKSPYGAIRDLYCRRFKVSAYFCHRSKYTSADRWLNLIVPSSASRILRAGIPTTTLLSAITAFSATNAPAPTTQLLPILAPLSKIAPMPINVLSPIEQP